jgi:predicted RNA binding protein YcfA (HicA-like mRNA interferase family)
MTQSDPPPILLANARKLRKQMSKRGWTEKMIREAMATPGIATRGQKGSATRYVHPVSGQSVIIDDVSGAVFHVGGKDFEYE